MTNAADKSLEDRTQDILANHLGLDDPPQMDDTLIALGADSLDTFEIAMACEEAFGIEVADSDVEQFKTVGDIVGYLRSQGVE